MPYNAGQDPYKFLLTDRTTFGNKTVAITPGVTDITPYPKVIILTAAGDISVTATQDADGTVRTFTACPVGFVVPLSVRRVTACLNGCIGVTD